MANTLDLLGKKRQAESMAIHTENEELKQACAKESGFGTSVNRNVSKRMDGETVVKIDINKIHPFKGKKGKKQPFKIDKAKVLNIKDSAKEVGIITPLIVREFEGEYQILSGHHRHKAGLELGLTELPCIVRDVPDEEVEKYIMEANIQRVKLLPSEYGNIFERYMEYRKDLDVTAEEVASKFGVSRKSLYRYTNVIKCIEEIQDLFDADLINIDCVDVIFALSEEEQRELIEYISTLKKRLTLKALKEHLGLDEAKPVKKEFGNKLYKAYAKKYNFTADNISEEDLDNVVDKALKEYITSQGYREVTEPETEDNLYHNDTKKSKSKGEER